MVFGRRKGEIGGGVARGATAANVNTKSTAAADAGAAYSSSHDNTRAGGGGNVDDTIIDDAYAEPSPVTDLLGIDTSAISLDGRSLVVPEHIGGGIGDGDHGDDEQFDDCVSSIGTGKYTYGGPPGFTTKNGQQRQHFGASIGYIGDLRIIGYSNDYDHDYDYDDDDGVSDVVGLAAATEVTPMPSQIKKESYDQPTKAHRQNGTASSSSSKRTNSQHHHDDDGASYTIGEDYSVRDVESAAFADGHVEDQHGHGSDMHVEKLRPPTTKRSNTKQQPKGKKTSVSKQVDVDHVDQNDDGGTRCLPAWLANAPFWLKIIIVSSLALLVGAVMLICLGAWFASNDDGNSSTSASTNDSNSNNSNDFTPITVPTMSPIPVDGTANEQQPQPSGPTSTQSQPMASPPAGVTPASPAGVDEIAGNNSSSNNNNPSPSVPSTTVSFYVIGGRFDGEGLEQLTVDLGLLPIATNTAATPGSGQDFPVLFHLGDWNSPFATSCDEASFQLNVETYSQSTVPVYFVPGDNEFNDCPNPEQAFGLWYDSFLGFESRYWPTPWWNVTRQLPDYAENFSFLQGRVLFVGINIVGGIVHDQIEWDTRHSSNIAWLNQTVSVNDGNFDALVVLGHADPDIEVNQNFFTAFFELVQTFDEQVYFIHRNLGTDTWQLEQTYNGITNLDVVVVEGSAWPPMYVEIDLANRALTIDQGSWFDNFLSSGELAFSSAALTSGF